MNLFDSSNHSLGYIFFILCFLVFVIRIVFLVELNNILIVLVSDDSVKIRLVRMLI